MKTKIEKTQKLWTIELVMVSMKNPSLDKLENDLTKSGFSEIHIKKDPINVTSE